MLRISQALCIACAANHVALLASILASAGLKRTPGPGVAFAPAPTSSIALLHTQK